MNEIENILEKYNKYINPSLARLINLNCSGAIEDNAEGVIVRDTQGKEYIDCLGGYGVFSAGHRHPKIIAAVEAQLKKLPLSSRTLFNATLADLSEALTQIVPENLRYSFFCNSGAEAVEGALKLARAYTGKSEFISAENSFHGKTFGALSATGRELFRKPFEPLVPGFQFVPFGDLQAIENKITDKTAAVILEPIQGEGGVIVPPDNYLAKVSSLCRKKNVLLILDEVQTGLGRTGKTFACHHYNVVPDILALGKALGGGVMPIGAFMSTQKIWSPFIKAPLMHTSTFGGNPLACAAALAFLKVFKEEDLTKKSERLGDYFKDGLLRIQGKYPQVINEVRGKGLFIGVELSKEGLGGLIFPDMLKKGIIVAFTLNNPKVVRFEPPLIITREQIDKVLEIFEDCVKKAAGPFGKIVNTAMNIAKKTGFLRY
jgi:putrescine aminotransferase